jgi:hypothetical protein
MRESIFGGARFVEQVSHAASLTGFDIARLAMKTSTQIRDLLAGLIGEEGRDWFGRWFAPGTRNCYD